MTASTSISGELLGTVDYSPYGEATGPLLSAFGYAGEWVDNATGYTYLRMRWLDTETGTFLSEDPLVQTTNSAFGYTEGNPITQIDPSGLFLKKIDNWVRDTSNIELMNDLSGILGIASNVLAITSLIPTPATPILAGIAFSLGLTSLALGSAATIGTCRNDLESDHLGRGRDCRWAVGTTLVTAVPIVGRSGRLVDDLGKFARTRYPKGKDLDAGELRGKIMGAQVGYTAINLASMPISFVSNYMKDKNKC